MKNILKNKKVKGFSLISILFLFWCSPSDFCQRLAFGVEVKEPTKLSPQEKGSAWDLPAGVYGEDEQGGDTNPPVGPGGSPQPGQGSYTRPSVGPGGSPAPGRGGDTGPPEVGPGGSPQPAN